MPTKVSLRNHTHDWNQVEQMLNSISHYSITSKCRRANVDPDKLRTCLEQIHDAFGIYDDDYGQFPHTSTHTFALFHKVYKERHNHPYGKLLEELRMLEPNPDIGFTGYHDGKSNNSISATAAENIMAYETNLCLGYTVMEAEAHTLNLSKSVTIENYRNGVFEDSSLITCIRDAAPRVAAQLKAKFGPRCMLGMSSNKDMLMNDTWLESAQTAKSNGLRKTMHKGNPVSDIYILDHDRDCIDTISMKISNSQLCSTSYTDILTLLKTVSYEIPGSYQYLEPIMEPSAHFYKKFPQTMTDLSKYKPGSDEWNTWHYYKNKMALLDNDFKIAESKFPEMKQLIVRHLVSGDFKFREDSLSIAGNVIHLFPSCPSKSYFKTVDEVVDEMCKVCTFETSFKTNTYTMDSWRAQLTYTKADLAELAG